MPSAKEEDHVKITRRRVWYVPHPAIPFRAVTIEYRWGPLLLIQKTIWRDIHKVCACWFIPNTALVDR